MCVCKKYHLGRAYIEKCHFGMGDAKLKIMKLSLVWLIYIVSPQPKSSSGFLTSLLQSLGSNPNINITEKGKSPHVRSTLHVRSPYIFFRIRGVTRVLINCQPTTKKFSIWVKWFTDTDKCHMETSIQIQHLKRTIVLIHYSCASKQRC